MKGWTQIASYARTYQAELRRDLLAASDIQAIIFNEKDSAFLLGEIGLYVEEALAQKAKFLIEEFSGWTLINSFACEKPVETLANLLADKDIGTRLVRKADYSSLHHNFELYIKNEDVDRFNFVLNTPENWVKIDYFNNQRQVELRVDLLEEKNIDSLLTFNRDVNFNVDKIDFYVNVKDKEAATKALTDFEGWTIIENYENLLRAEIREDLLKQNDIDVILVKQRNEKAAVFQVDLLVRDADKDEALQLIYAHKEWLLLGTYSRIYLAELRQDVLKDNDIQSVILNERDRTFLLGEIELYVEDVDLEKAKEILDEFEQQQTDIEETAE